MPIYFKTQWDRYGEFSNLYMCEFQVCARDIFVDEDFDSALVDEVITVYSAEQALAWMKAILMNDVHTALLIRNTASPKECRRLSEEMKSFDRAKWEMWREEIAVYVLTEKFSSSDRLLAVLETSKGRSIAEANADDRVWGIGICKQQAISGMQWQGQNLLGRTLEVVRANLILG